MSKKKVIRDEAKCLEHLREYVRLHVEVMNASTPPDVHARSDEGYSHLHAAVTALGIKSLTAWHRDPMKEVFGKMCRDAGLK